MGQQDIIRAWKNEMYRLSLGPVEFAQLPPNPAGTIEVTDEDLKGEPGGQILTFPNGCSAFCSSWGCDTRPFYCW